MADYLVENENQNSIWTQSDERWCPTLEQKSKTFFSHGVSKNLKNSGAAGLEG